MASASASYVTGSHNIKAGFQWGFGSYVLEYDINGDLTQRYNNGVPYEVLIWSTPVRSEEFLNGYFRASSIQVFVDEGSLDGERRPAC